MAQKNQMQKDKFDRKAATWPKDPQALKRLERHIEFGELGDLPLNALPNVPRYLVTYMNSQTGRRIRSTTVVTVTNQSNAINRVWVSFFKVYHVQLRSMPHVKQAGCLSLPPTKSSGKVGFRDFLA